MGEITIGKALGDYKTVYMPYRNFAERTREEYTNDLEDLVKYAQGQSVEHVSGLGLAIIHRYVAQLEDRGYSSLTRKRKVVAIRSFLGFLYQDDYVRTDIGAKLILPFTETSTPHILTQAECDRLRNACASNPRDAAIIELLLQTGIRLSELTGLKLNDIDLEKGNESTEGEGGFIRILGGGRKKERTIPLNSMACVAIKKYLNTRNKSDNSNLFLNRFGAPLGERGVQKLFRMCFKMAEIQRASIHTLRHTFGVQQLRKGKSLKTVQELMGHHERRSTLVYATLGRELR